MAIIPTVGRKSFKTRFVIAMLYIVLSLGAVTMVYPFLLMIGNSLTSDADMQEFRPIPRYIYSNEALFPKYAVDRYAGDIDLINQLYGTQFSRIDSILPPKITSTPAQLKAQVQDWERFVEALPINYKQACFEGFGSAPSLLKNRYREFCRKRFGGDITKQNRLYLEENESFETVTVPFERFKMREWEPDDSPKMREWIQFKKRLPPYFMRAMMVDPSFQAYLKDAVYDAKINDLNKAWGTHYKDFREIHLAPTLPSQPGQAKDWEGFVRQNLAFRYMKIEPSAAKAYREFLRQRYGGNLAVFNKMYGSRYRSFDEISLPSKIPIKGAPQVDYSLFVAKALPIRLVTATNTENLYRAHLARRFGTIAAVNQAFGTRYASFAEVSPPVYNADWYHVQTNAGAIRKDFLTRNYSTVIGYILLHGRAVLNTVIFVVAVILIHLIVNPMCAYALSRYNLPYAYKVLLFLLATMAFPAEVAMIPSFLLLKQFHLLNTYWALILPGMANGYAIFLLKGFFDSLPKELYEAGIIDGASEATMFRKITIPMSKPIFAVIALQSFTGAYGAFMYAMLVCQDPKMWTIMVWLYQLQTTAPQYVTMAALVVAAIPTLLVFIFAQNVIMRGIIIPSFK